MKTQASIHMNARLVHRASASLVATFAVVHLVNHLTAVSSVEAHMAFMEDARRIYRQTGVEAVLLLCVAAQVGSGLWLVVRGWRVRRGFVAWLQAASGSVLSLFLLVHVGSVLYGRVALGLDTNLYYAAAGLHVASVRGFFAPYYAAGVLALSVHLACAARHLLPVRGSSRTLTVWAALVAGAALSALIVGALAGAFHSFSVPPHFLQTYSLGP